ncbi:hypothetical protein BDN72DRAFT_833322 [Pluteus cervinus]|uniref:Uncharacterized protein n=1 Tax=Pluteus cervinus TaxID=181527 RepID=A0ACD3B9B0_9AGAR|nr:hypothetical protein BDN72DRAFT_833322 [Pluteus cervinus]
MEDVAPTAAQALSVANSIRICQIISSVIVLYDHLITLDQEIDLVWVRPWSPAKFLFLWNRYLGTIFLLLESVSFIKPTSDNVSHTWAYIELSFTSLIIWSMQFIMLFRTMALFKHRRLVRYLGVVSFFCEVVAMSVIMVLSYDLSHATDDVLPVRHICVPDRLPFFLYGMWIPVLLFECFLFGLVLWVSLRHTRNMRAVDDMANKNHMWETLLGDSILYFLITSSAYLLALVFELAISPEWFQLPQPLAIAATTVTGTRLILNLREAYYFPPRTSDEDVDVDVSAGLVMRLRALPTTGGDGEDTGNWKWKRSDGASHCGSNTVLELKPMPSGDHEGDRSGGKSKSA